MHFRQHIYTTEIFRQVLSMAARQSNRFNVVGCCNFCHSKKKSVFTELEFGLLTMTKYDDSDSRGKQIQPVMDAIHSLLSCHCDAPLVKESCMPSCGGRIAVTVIHSSFPKAWLLVFMARQTSASFHICVILV